MRRSAPIVAVVAVVDDDSRILESLESLLSSVGHEVRVYPNAKEFLATRPFSDLDCLVSDLGMPGLSGLELVGILRMERPTLPVIVITAQRNEQMRAAALALGARFVFPKPLDETQLLEAIQAVMTAPPPP